MASRFGLQARVALDKQCHPHLYCDHPRCLWRTGGGRCPRHLRVEDTLIPTERLEAIIEASSMAGAYTRSGRRPSQRAFRARLAYGSPPIPGSSVRPSEGRS